MARLTLSLLGSLEIKLDGKPITRFDSNRVRALLIYLAVESDRPHRRETLAGLLWPDWPDRSAMTNLRNALSNLRAALQDRVDAQSQADKQGRPYLIVDRETVQFDRPSDCWVDVLEFENQLRVVSSESRVSHLETRDSQLTTPDSQRLYPAALETGVRLYRGSFLEGFSLRDSPPFEHWALVTRERLQRQEMEALQRLGVHHESRGEYEQALQHARRQLELEPWSEEAHRQTMRALALSGQRSAALAQYEACVRALKVELDVEPAAETIELYQQIRDGLVVPLMPAATPPAPAQPPPYLEPAEPRPAPPLPEGALWGQVPSVDLQVAAAAPFPAGERRLATALLAEVCGAEELMEELGNEGWAEAMEELLSLLEGQVSRYGGSIDHRHEEGLVAVFGVPLAHEDDPERAVLAGLGMIEGVRQYALERAKRGQAAKRPSLERCLRVGVDTGEVIVAWAGEGARQREGMALGRAIMLAQRAATGAEPGVVQVGENAYRLLCPLFDWQPVSRGPIAPGVVQPPVAYRVLAFRPRAAKPRGIAGLESPLVGRQAEFRALQEAVERLRSGIGGIVTLVGEAGIGKSRLVAEVRRTTTDPQHARRNMGQTEYTHATPDTKLAPHDLLWLEGRCLSYATGFAYQVWVDLLRGLLGVSTDEPSDTVRQTLRQRVQDWCPDLFDPIYPYHCRLLSLPLEDQYAVERDLQGESLKAGMFSAVQALIESVARQQSIVLVCEDMHWADPTSLELLERLLPLVDRVPLLFLCVFRPETEHGCWRIKEVAARQYRHRHTDLWLEALSDDESRALVENLLRVEDLPQHLRGQILDRGEGNPFYLEEIVRSLIDGGALAYDASKRRWQATRDTPVYPLPDTLHGVLAARIDYLPAETRRVLRRAAVIGRIFSHRLLAALVDVPSPAGGRREGVREDIPLPQAEEGPGVRALDAHLLALQQQQLVRERARVPELEYIFKHELTREAAYDGLLERERRACHRQVAEALEHLYPERIEEQVGLLAHHWEQAGEMEKAVEYLLRAGDQARVAYANEEATGYYRRALALLAEPESSARGSAQRRRWRMEALRGLGIVLFGVGRVQEAEAPLREVLELGQEAGLEPRTLARLHYWLGESLWWKDRYDEAIEVLEEGLGLLGAGDESPEAAMMVGPLAASRARKGDRSWIEISLRTAQFIRRLPYSEELRPAYNLIVMAHMENKAVEEAKRWNQIENEEAASSHDLRALAEVARMAGEISLREGDLPGAIAQYRQALQSYTQIGDTKHKNWAMAGIAAATWSLGNLEESERAASQRLELTQMTDGKWESASAHTQIGLIHLARRDWQRARESLQKVEQIEHATYGHWSIYEADSNLVLGCAALGQGDGPGAISHLQKAIERCDPTFTVLYPTSLALALSALEAAYQDPSAFRAFCQRYRQEHPAIAGSFPMQWYMEPVAVGAQSSPQPTDVGAIREPPLHDEFATNLSPAWAWHDPLGDCSFRVQDGLEIRAANGRDLWGINWSAPRAMVDRPLEGDFTIQVSCLPAMDDRPAIGGLLLWQDRENYLRLDRGVFGKDQVTLMGTMANQNVVVGRGLLPVSAGGRVLLRLERHGERVETFCSADGGAQWFTVGHVEFPVSGPIQAGPHAIGAIDRAIYHGVYPEGTAIRFQSFELWDTPAT